MTDETPADPVPPVELYTNAPRELVIAGVTYVVRDLDTDRLIALAKWFKDRAKADVESWDAEEHVKAAWRKAVSQDIAAGLYDPGGEAFVIGNLTPAGAAHALWMAIADQPENAGKPVAEFVVAKWLADRIEAAAVESVKVVGDPKASSPGASAPGDNSSPGSGTATTAARGGRSTKSNGSPRRKSR